MAFIRTILGDIEPAELGVCNSHEHLIRSGGPEVQDPDYYLDDVDLSTAEMERWVAAGGKSIVSLDVLGCGRNVKKMIEVANRLVGKAHIVAATGVQKSEFYDANTSFFATNSVGDIVELLALEITEGMDFHSYNGPIVKRSSAKAGVIKAGTGYCSINQFERKFLRIAAETQTKTGVPVCIHTERGTMGYEATCILEEYGARLDHVALSHLNKNPDKNYYKKILKKGVYSCFDGPNRPKYYPDSLLIENIKWLIEEGFQSQIMLGMDAGRSSYFSTYTEARGIEHPGIPYLLTIFIPSMLEAGISQQAIDDIMIHNPARFFSFIES